jgi:hypothetical protein
MGCASQPRHVKPLTGAKENRRKHEERRVQSERPLDVLFLDHAAFARPDQAERAVGIAPSEGDLARERV